MRNIENKTILITGCCGTVGKALIQRIISLSPSTSMICMDVNESELFRMMQQNNQNNLKFELCDIRSKQVKHLVKKSDIVFHCAAYKHVYFGNKNVEELKSVNIDGTENILSALDGSNVTDFIFTSSDKAANPISSMGITKLFGERLISSANKNTSTRCSSVRFGNVIGSSGSVYQIFKSQIIAGEPLTLTNIEMTRFIMTPFDSADLILKTLRIAHGGEILISKMPALKIENLANVMIEMFSNGRDITKKIIGISPQEKIFEELMSPEEGHICQENKDFFVLNGNTEHSLASNKLDLRSDRCDLLSNEEIKRFIFRLENE
jgi:FlaA1/EpsC-like NDP-sugar epimerase